MASGGQSKRRKSYDLKFKLDAGEINGKLMTWRVLIEAGSRINAGSRIQAGGKVSCTDRSRGLLSEVLR